MRSSPAFTQTVCGVMNHSIQVPASCVMSREMQVAHQCKASMTLSREAGQHHRRASTCGCVTRPGCRQRSCIKSRLSATSWTCGHKSRMQCNAAAKVDTASLLLPSLCSCSSDPMPCRALANIASACAAHHHPFLTFGCGTHQHSCWWRSAGCTRHT